MDIIAIIAEIKKFRKDTVHWVSTTHDFTVDETLEVIKPILKAFKNCEVSIEFKNDRGYIKISR